MYMRYVCIYIHICVYTYMYIYIYICVYRLRRSAGRVGLHGLTAQPVPIRAAWE